MTDTVFQYLVVGLLLINTALVMTIPNDGSLTWYTVIPLLMGFAYLFGALAVSIEEGWTR